ncbi:MAG: hypothetical protein H6Q70_58 [Firmicutes bacterium]|nr:hypothetical protein [Bacillota bacterium]
MNLNNLSIDWIVGFAWGIGTIINSNFYIRYHDEALLIQIAQIIEVKPIIYHSQRIKTFARVPLSNILPQKLFQLGWTGRLDKTRQYPKGDINELDFIRGYCYTKSTKDVWHYKNRRGEKISSDRLRIWGSRDIVANIDRYIVENLETTPKKPYPYRNKTQDGYQGECYSVQYQSKREVPRIVQMINMNSGK